MSKYAMLELISNAWNTLRHLELLGHDQLSLLFFDDLSLNPLLHPFSFQLLLLCFIFVVVVHSPIFFFFF